MKTALVEKELNPVNGVELPVKMPEINRELKKEIAARKWTESEKASQASFPRENPNPVLESNAGGNVIYANPATQRVLDALGVERIAGILPVHHTQIVQNCLEGGQSVSEVETTVQDRVFSRSYHPIVAAEVVHLYAFDITERKQAEEALQNSEARLEGMVEHLPSGVCLLDVEQRLVVVNPVARKHLSVLADGVSVGEVVSCIGEHSLAEVLTSPPWAGSRGGRKGCLAADF